MGFKDWLNEDVDVSSALKEKAENGLNIKTKFGTFKFDKMDKKKYVFILDGEDKDVKVVVSEKDNGKTLDLSISVFKGDELVGKSKSEKDEDSEQHYEKSDVTKKAVKDIKKAIEAILGSLNEEEIVLIDEDFGLTALAGAMAPFVLVGIPALYKSAVENNWLGLGNEKETKILKTEDITDRLKNFSLKTIQGLLKDERKLDAFVDELISTIKKNSPRFMDNPKTRGEIYNKVLSYLRRSAEAKSKTKEAEPMAKVKDAAKETLARSSGYHKGGIWFGTQN